MRKVLFLTVVYGTSPSEASTLISLATHNFLQFKISPTFVIWDNSVAGFGYDSIPQLTGNVKYFHTGNNTPLSRVYNRIISEYSDVDWIVFLDDDSYIDNSYLLSLQEFWNSNIPLAIPRIELSNTLISPGKLVGVRGRALKHDEIHQGSLRSKGLAAMMSGTIARRDIFNKELGFDERLSFYGIDTRFFIDYSNIYPYVYLLNTTMRHSSALRDPNLNNDALLRRIGNLLQSWSLVFDTVPHYRFRLICYMTIFIFKYVIKKKSIKFLKLFKIIPTIIFR